MRAAATLIKKSGNLKLPDFLIDHDPAYPPGVAPAACAEVV